MKKIAILYVATGKYLVFWPDFLASAEQNLLPGCEVHYFVFTDAERIDGEDGNCPVLSKKAREAMGCRPYTGCPSQTPGTLSGRVHRIAQEAYPWPYATLKRFHMFRPLLPRLKAEGFDCVYFLNANYLIVRPVLPEDLLPRTENELVLCLHPGYYSQKPLRFPYDRNPRCRAWIPYTKGKHYVCGGTNGGSLHAYADLICELDDRVEADLTDGIIARWHDESQLNRYLLDTASPVRLLTPAFCAPEGWPAFPFEAAFLVRDKSKWLDVASVKGAKNPENPLIHRLQAQREKLAPYLGLARDTLLRR